MADSDGVRCELSLSLSFYYSRGETPTIDHSTAITHTSCICVCNRNILDIYYVPLHLHRFCRFHSCMNNLLRALWGYGIRQIPSPLYVLLDWLPALYVLPIYYGHIHIVKGRFFSSPFSNPFLQHRRRRFSFIFLFSFVSFTSHWYIFFFYRRRVAWTEWHYKRFGFCWYDRRVPKHAYDFIDRFILCIRTRHSIAVEWSGLEPFPVVSRKYP